MTKELNDVTGGAMNASARPVRGQKGWWHVTEDDVPMLVRRDADGSYTTSADNGHTWISSPVAGAADTFEGAVYAHVFYHQVRS